MSEKSTLEWTPNLVLKWSDFQAEPNPAVFEDSHSVVKYRLTWVVNSEKVDERIVFFIEDISLVTEFHPLLSWVRASEANASLLGHEQGNFDLAESVKRKNLPRLREKFYKKYFPTRGQNQEQQKQHAKDDSGKMINKEIEILQRLYDVKSLEYHSQTNYGKDAESQREYDLIFKDLRP